MQPMLNIAVKAALNAGKIITRSFERLPDQSVIRKNEHDFVTTIERAAEESIVELLQKSYPDHAIVSEETGGDFDAEYTWLVDPLDGTINYIHGFPHFCVSLALLHKQRIAHSVVYDPMQQELFTASRGKGAQLNNRRLRVSTQTFLEDALLACPFPTIKTEQAETQIEVLNKLHQHTGGLRHSGAASLALAYVAAGRLDGFWGEKLTIWNIAASSLFVEEAGGLVSDWDARPDYLNSPKVIAANPKLFKQLLPLVQKGYN
jgi:myo-inositol-1(or 4)-monophosphatase